VPGAGQPPAGERKWRRSCSLPPLEVATMKLQHRQVQAGALEVHVVEGGSTDDPSILFLHGWPQDASAFARVMEALVGEAHVVAIDLPGVGGSAAEAPAGDKQTLARCVRSVARALSLQDLTLFGHDAGGQIVYAYLHAFPDDLRAAVMANVAVPGVLPWPEIERDPRIWHFNFHAVPELPEAVVAGRERRYFDYFFERLSADPNGVPPAARERYARAYARPGALRAGFEWYRAFPQDKQDNLAVRGQRVATPVLYLRGDAEPGATLDQYVAGLRDGGLVRVRGQKIAGSGHFLADEQPEALAEALRTFLRSDEVRRSA
jgi:pimeloyl-ACP methyl ester carboxylesterase